MSMVKNTGAIWRTMRPVYWSAMPFGSRQPHRAEMETTPLPHRSDNLDIREPRSDVDHGLYYASELFGLSHGEMEKRP